MMKILLTITILLLVVPHFALSQSLPEDAKRILEKLAKYENDELKKTEQEIIKRKQDVIKSLERSEKKIKSKEILKLYSLQIKKLKEEVEDSEELIKGEMKLDDSRGDDKKNDRRGDIVDFDVVYHYSHPMDAFSDQKGELIFYKDNKARLTHKKANGEVVFGHVVPWEIIDGRIEILDEVHGHISVRRKEKWDSKVIRLKWIKLDKRIFAEQR